MGKITVKPVTRDDVIPVVRLSVKDEQEDFLAPNSVSLAQVHYEGGGYPFAIRSDGELVGFIQVIDFRESPHLDDGDDPNTIYLWRFMISEDHQGQGIGRRAMHWFENWSHDRGVARTILTVAPENEVAIGLYESCGYTRTGNIFEGEVEFAKQLG